MVVGGQCDAVLLTVIEGIEWGSYRWEVQMAVSDTEALLTEVQFCLQYTTALWSWLERRLPRTQRTAHEHAVPNISMGPPMRLACFLLGLGMYRIPCF